MNDFILIMPLDKWFKIPEENKETSLFVIKDFIDKNILWPDYLSLNTNYTSFIKRSSIGYKQSKKGFWLKLKTI